MSAFASARSRIFLRLIVWSLTTVVGGLGPTASRGQEWTRFRGPNGTGVHETRALPTELTSEHIRWEVELPGVGHASPVLWGDRIFVQSAIPEDGTQILQCRDATTGTLVWDRRFPSGTYLIHTRNSFASASPAVDADRVYLAWATPEMLTVAALTHEGQPVWQVPLGPYKSSHGFGTSPIAYRDMVIVGDQQLADEENTRPLTSSIVALDAASGKIRWRSPRKSSVASYSVPCIYQSSNGLEQIICCSTGHGIYSLDPSTGAENWAFDAFTMRTVSSPLVVGTHIFGSTGSGAGGNYVVAVRAEPTPSIDYKVDDQAPYVPTPVAKGDLLFLWSDKGVVSCVSAESGKVHWRQRVGANYSSSPVRAGDAVYCLSEDGDLVVVAAENEYRPLGKLSLGYPGRSTPAITKNRLFVRTDSRLFAIGRP